MCGEFAIGSLAIVRLEEDIGLFVWACVTGVESFEIADAIIDEVKKAKIEGV